jgi:release factor glutamine methyltransferase
MSAPQTAANALRDGVAALKRAGIDGAAGDGRALLAHAMDIAPDRLTLHLQDVISAPASARFAAYISARAGHQPVAQIIGRRLFWGRDFIVTRDTLDPRPETETLVAEAVSRPFVKMLDLGTGTGCILLSCLADMPMAVGVGADVSLAGLNVAQRNAAALGLDRRASFQIADWFTGITGRFDLIVSNPPYIAADEMAGLSPDVQEWEPHLALTDGADGLNAYRAIAAGAGARLMEGGRILLEIGPTQGAAVSQLLAAQGFDAIRILPDFDGRDRVVCAHKPLDTGNCAS